MLKKILKWVGIVVGVLVVLIVLLVGGLYVNGTSKLSKTYSIQVEPVAIPTDAAASERGKRWVSIYCTSCHGDDLAGTAFFNDPALGSISAKNLTKGKGGIGSTYTDEDWIRTLRHGVRPDGKSVFVMPANAFYYLSDGDLGDIIAYLKNAPPVDKEWAPPSFTFLSTVLVGVGVFDSSFAAASINHSAPRPTASAKGVTKEYGDYLVKVGDCRVCHGQQLSGGKLPDCHDPRAEPHARRRTDWLEGRRLHQGDAHGDHASGQTDERDHAVEGRREAERRRTEGDLPVSAIAPEVGDDELI